MAAARTVSIYWSKPTAAPGLPRRVLQPRILMAPAVPWRRRSPPASPRGSPSTRRCARPRPMSAPPLRLRTGLKSAPATARCIIFTSGGKFRREATEGSAVPLHFRDVEDRRGSVMRKSIVLPGAAVTLAAVALLLPLCGQQAVAEEAQAFVNVVDLEISPASMPRFLA